MKVRIEKTCEIEIKMHIEQVPHLLSSVYAVAMGHCVAFKARSPPHVEYLHIYPTPPDQSA